MIFITVNHDIMDKLKSINKNRYLFNDDGSIFDKVTNKFKKITARKDGYGIVELELLDGTRKLFLSHRVTAFFFCEIPKDIPEEELVVDHIIPVSMGGDSKASNLRWTDEKGNGNNPLTKHNMSIGSTGKKQSLETIIKRVNKNVGQKRTLEQKMNISRGKYKPIIQYTLDGEFVKEWESIKAASEEMKYSRGNISECCNGKRKSTNGFIFRFKKE